MKGGKRMKKLRELIEAVKAKASGILRDKERRRELLTYILFGVLTTAVNYAVYWLMTLITGMKTWPAESGEYILRANVSNFTAWVLSVLFAFVTNKKYVFRSGKGVGNGAVRELVLFFLSRAASYLIFDLALFTLCLYIMPDLVDKLLMNVLVVIFNYFMSRIVVFKKK